MDTLLTRTLENFGKACGYHFEHAKIKPQHQRFGEKDTAHDKWKVKDSYIELELFTLFDLLGRSYIPIPDRPEITAKLDGLQATYNTNRRIMDLINSIRTNHGLQVPTEN